MAMSVAEGGTNSTGPLYLRGDLNSEVENVPRGFLRAAAHGSPPSFSPNESGRRELAEWIASTNNPLTARVFANRAWLWLFGAGLVRTPDDFGPSGEPPLNPELLDYLAVRFMEDGWSAKKLIREIVLSRAYQLSSAPSDELEKADPENKLFARAFRRRLDAESMRDAMLSASGQLLLTHPGPTIIPGTASDFNYENTGHWRSVYLPALRNSLPAIFDAFDFADTSSVTGLRRTSTAPRQALFFLNNLFVIEQSRAAAKRLLEGLQADSSIRVTRAYRLTLGRAPSPRELRAALNHITSSRADGESEAESWAELFQALFASFEFRNIE
jgi:hypothetical protein